MAAADDATSTDKFHRSDDFSPETWRPAGDKVNGTLDVIYRCLWARYAEGVDEYQERAVLQWHSHVTCCGDPSLTTDYPRMSRLGVMPFTTACADTELQCCCPLSRRSRLVQWFDILFGCDTVTSRVWARANISFTYLILVIAILMLYFSDNLLSEDTFTAAVGPYFDLTVYYLYLLAVCCGIGILTEPIMAGSNVNTRWIYSCHFHGQY